ncbi:MAG: helix-turn-helix domain-containing protein, partial [Bosea sp. (in: a-proteobacteria)]
MDGQLTAHGSGHRAPDPVGRRGRSLRWIALQLKRSAPTISREVKRSAGSASGYDAVSAALASRARRR